VIIIEPDEYCAMVKYSAYLCVICILTSNEKWRYIIIIILLYFLVSRKQNKKKKLINAIQQRARLSDLHFLQSARLQMNNNPYLCILYLL